MTALVASTSGPRIRIQVDVAPGLPAVKADINQLEMAILNLAVNARDAMSAGGTLSIEAREQAASDAGGPDLKLGRYVRLSVSDTGTGMSDEVLARAVEPFFSTKGIGQGTGLGLSMVHGLAAQLGGALTIVSRPGLGTSVNLWLPIASDRPDRADDGQTVEADLAHGTVLLVDDDQLTRVSTAEMLGELGYVVVEAASGEEALRLVDAGITFDLLVTDHLMPGVTGAELADRLTHIRPGTPVLIISGYAEVEGIAPHLKRLAKPFRQAELATSLAQFATRTADSRVASG